MRLHPVLFWIAPLLVALPLMGADADSAGPKGAMKAFYQAMEAGDAAAVRGSFYTSNDAEKSLADADAAQLVAARGLGEAIKNKFAATGDALSRGLPLKDEIARLDSAEVSIDGDHATLKPAGQNKALRLIKSEGRWKISIADYAGATAGNIAAQTAVLKDLAEVYLSIATDISADKFASAQDAQKALQQKLQAVVGNALHKHPPATKPK
jgi:hypothetical protein